VEEVERWKMRYGKAGQSMGISMIGCRSPALNSLGEYFVESEEEGSGAVPKQVMQLTDPSSVQQPWKLRCDPVRPTSERDGRLACLPVLPLDNSMLAPTAGIIVAVMILSTHH
jgi:hypothetical protein